MRFRRFPLLLAVAVSLGIVAAAAGSTSSGPLATSRAAKTTVTFWHAYSSDSPEVKTIDTVLIPKFERAHPSIEVKAVAIPYDSLHQKLLTATAGGTLPDVVRSDIIWVPELANLGVLAPLDKTMPDFKQLAKKTFPGALATNRWKGHYYGLPLDTNTRVQMYNTQALAQAGAKSPPKTFADMRRLASRLKGKKTALFADGGTSGWSVLPWIWSAGGAITNAKITRSTGYLNSRKSVAGVALLVDLHRQGVAKFLNVDGSGLQTSDGLAQGKYATILDGPWMYPIFAGQYPDFHLNAARVPKGPGGSVSVVGGEDIVLTSSSKQKNAAAGFIRFMLSEQAQIEMATVGQMTIRKDLKSKLTKIHGYYGIFLDQLATARPRTPHPAWPKMDNIIETQVAKAIRGDASPQRAMDDAAKQIDALLR